MLRQNILQTVTENTAAVQRLLATSRDQFLLGMGINRAQLETLTLLSKQPMSVKRLAELLKITGGGATQIIDGLVANGFVEKKVNPGDRRSINVKLTKEGQTRFEKIRVAYIEQLNEILGAVSDSQLHNLAKLTEQILQQIKATTYLTDKK